MSGRVFSAILMALFPSMALMLIADSLGNIPFKVIGTISTLICAIQLICWLRKGDKE